MRSFSDKVKTQDVRAALRVGTSVGLPLLVLFACGRVDIAVYAAFGALTSLYGHSETAERRADTELVVGAGMVATIAVGAIYAATQGPAWLLGTMLAAVVIGAGTLGTVMGWVPRGEIFFVLAFLVVAEIPLKPEQVGSAIAASAGGAGTAILLTLLGGKSALNARARMRHLKTRAADGAAKLDMRQHIVIIAAAAIGVVGAWFLALTLHIGHPFWSPVTVAALMPALTSSDIFRRTFQLVLGTLGGVCLAFLLFSTEPSVFALIVLITVFQGVAELFVVRNYAIALLFISPLAIGMSNLGRGLAWTPLLVERLIEAGLGSVVAVATIMICRVVLTKLAPSPQVGGAP